MSINTVETKVTETLEKVVGLPFENGDGRVINPIPDNPFSRVGTYMEVSDEAFDYGYVGQTSIDDPTSSTGFLIVFITIHEDMVPDGWILRTYIRELVLRIRSQIKIDTRDNVYCDDGDVGFAITMTEARYHYSEGSPYAHARIVLRATAYV